MTGWCSTHRSGGGAQERKVLEHDESFSLSVFVSGRDRKEIDPIFGQIDNQIDKSGCANQGLTDEGPWPRRNLGGTATASMH